MNMNMNMNMPSMRESLMAFVESVSTRTLDSRI